MKQLDHIGIAVSSLEKSLAVYTQGLGMQWQSTEEIQSEKIRVAMLLAGDSRVELLEPLSSESPISAFLEKRGEGVHHLAFEVEDVEEEVAKRKKAGARFIDPAPRTGAHGTKVAFLHPRFTGGVLIELVERFKSEED